MLLGATNWKRRKPKVKSSRNKEKADNTEYLARLQEASQDPESFERFLMKTENEDDEEENKMCKKDNKENNEYQRIEDWDANRKQNDTVSWEERVQFDGQKYGNKVQQNDILNKNLREF
eukprot:CAMPEP_0194135976 /NCGR_PEP_ID=MMETSP0152-20130528/6030_1 /TAXON_ID=1049557 /ORGANISM="Thalassiothrix antarctica, Strain L6-D1" /LENGTH=118 /DNA_ID=CAMNT_0038832445 /DNA_START=123 /DNA_END=479 /DNA_ORIENTATION=-